MRQLIEQTVCEWQNVEPNIPLPESKLGIALGTLGKEPINGLRQNPENGTNGWYIWCGTEMPLEDDAFSPLHVEHIETYLAGIKAYLSLPPGYRFLIDGNNYEDAWYDEALLHA